MFGLFDSQTPRVASLLVERAMQVDTKYGGLSWEELGAQVTADFPEKMRFVIGDQVTFHYPDLPEFQFGFMSMGGGPTLVINAAEQYHGLMVQHSSETGWYAHVTKPAFFPIGRKAKALARCLAERGIRSLDLRWAGR